MNGNDELATLRAEFPDWTIMRIFGGYRAVPKGVPVVEAAYIDTMRDNLANAEWNLPDGLARALARHGGGPDAA